MKGWTQHGADCSQRLGSQALPTAPVEKKAEEILRFSRRAHGAGLISASEQRTGRKKVRIYFRRLG